MQITDFENAAFALFIVLLSRAILSFDLNLYMPISKVDVNMQTAQKRNAVHEEKFYFRKNVFASGASTKASSASSSSSSLDESGQPKPKEKKLRNCFPAPSRTNSDVSTGPVEEEYELMTLQEIMLGKVRNLSSMEWTELIYETNVHVHVIIGERIPWSSGTRECLFRYIRD